MSTEENDMIIVTREEWDKIPSDYRGEWTRWMWEFRNNDFPEEWIGRKTMLHYDNDNGTVLLTEGVHFIIQ
jgi:hypothetical protein